MKRVRRDSLRAFTLLEVSLVVGLLALIAAIVVPNFIRQIKAEELPRSARQLRSLITLTRANAAFDGKRYRLRFPDEKDDPDLLFDDRQPIVEREDDPIKEPEVFNLVTSPWAVGGTLLGDVWCAEIRPGRPTIERIKERRDRVAEQITEKLIEQYEDIDPERPPLIIEPDGSSDWATFVLTNGPRDMDIEQLEDYARVEVILDGAMGLSWLQRPFYDEELDLFEEKNWPAVLRQDFLDPRVLTEDDVLEIREMQLRGSPVERSGRELQVEP